MMKKNLLYHSSFIISSWLPLVQTLQITSIFTIAMPYKLLFVCLGNICRSPAAENIMNYLVEQNNLSDRIICDSAGTGGYHVGSPPDERMTATAASLVGIELQGRARQLQKSDLENFDLILAMDRENYQDILALDPAKQYWHKVHLMCDFCTQHSTKEVPDPYYGGAKGFTRVINLLIDACDGLLEHVNEQLGTREKAQ